MSVCLYLLASSLPPSVLSLLYSVFFFSFLRHIYLFSFPSISAHSLFLSSSPFLSPSISPTLYSSLISFLLLFPSFSSLPPSLLPHTNLCSFLSILHLSHLSLLPQTFSFSFPVTHLLLFISRLSHLSFFLSEMYVKCLTLARVWNGRSLLKFLRSLFPIFKLYMAGTV